MTALGVSIVSVNVTNVVFNYPTTIEWTQGAGSVSVMLYMLCPNNGTGSDVEPITYNQAVLQDNLAPNGTFTWVPEPAAKFPLQANYFQCQSVSTAVTTASPTAPSETSLTPGNWYEIGVLDTLHYQVSPHFQVQYPSNSSTATSFSISTTPSSITANGTTTPTLNPSTARPANNNPASTNTGISTGMKVGVAMAGVVVAIVTVALIFLVVRYRLLYRKHIGDSGDRNLSEDRNEMSMVKAELHGEGSNFHPKELDGEREPELQGTPISELPVRDNREGRFELDSPIIPLEKD